MRNYRCLSENTFTSGPFQLVPLRDEDKYVIMKWRNEQIHHLRQSEPLTKEDQENYFSTIISSLFDQEKPIQLLFSFLKDSKCIGYGGLVHINWLDRNAEVSFIMKTELEQEEFSIHWSTFLRLLEQIAFNELNFHKIYVYAFDLRPHLYKILLANQYKLDARLKEHCLYDGKFIDVVIHSKWNSY